MNRLKFSLCTLLSGAFALPSLVLVATPGYAQQIEEITVSVRRREENLQEVPLSVTTIGAEQIERYGINNTQDVVKYTAGLEFDEGLGAQDTRIVIRGLSPTRGRSNVALLVDGIDYTGEAISTAGGGLLFSQQLLDVERVEVVKGPQSALYGRSAFAGAIQYIAKKPNLEESEGSANVQFGSGLGAQGLRVSGAYGAPVTDSFGLRVNGLAYNQDGYYDNSLTGEPVGGSNGYGIALAGLWEPADSVSVNGRVAYSRDEYEPQAQARVQGNTIVDINDSVAVQNGSTPSLVYTSGLGTLVNFSYPDCGATSTPSDLAITSCLGTPKVLTVGKMPDADQLQIIQSEDPRTESNYEGTEVDTVTAQLAINWDVGAGTVSSYTGFAGVDSDQFFDAQTDALPAGSYGSLDGTYNFTLAGCGLLNCSPTVQEINFDNETRLFSQEFRFATSFDGPLNFTVGALAWLERVKQLESSNSISPAIFRQAPSFVPAPPVPGEPLPINSQPAGNANIANVFQAAPGRVSRDTDSYSLYGLVEWEISDNWKASFEGRWVSEELEVSGPVCDTAATLALSGLDNQTIGGDEFCNMAFRGSSSVGIANGNGSLAAGTYTKAIFQSTSAQFDGTFFAPKAVLEWTPTDSQLLYLSVSNGIKPGGISTITAGSFFDPSQNTFDKEKLWAYELGSKSTLLDGRLLINGALFYQDYTDKQVGVTRFDPVIQTDVGAIENAGESEVYGVELEAAWLVTEYLSLSAGYTYTQAEYTDFSFETGSANNIARSIAAGAGGCLAIIDNDPGNPDDDQTDNCLVDLSGNDIEDVPRHSFVGSARYEAPLGFFDPSVSWYADASFIYRDSRYIDEFNIKELQAYWLMDFRAGLRQETWEITLFVDNVFDDDTVKSGIDFGSQVDTTRQGLFPPGPGDGVVVTLPDPRVVGVRANFQF